MALVLKDPTSSLDYLIDWGGKYLGDDTLAESSWSVVPMEPGGVTVDGSSFDTVSASVSVSGGMAGKCYRLLNQIQTSSGRDDARSITLRVESR